MRIRLDDRVSIYQSNDSGDPETGLGDIPANVNITDSVTVQERQFTIEESASAIVLAEHGETIQPNTWLEYVGRRYKILNIWPVTARGRVHHWRIKLEAGARA